MLVSPTRRPLPASPFGHAVLHGLDRGGLGALVDRGDDLVPATVDVGAAQLDLGLELLLDLGDEVAVGTALALVGVVLHRLGERGLLPVGLAHPALAGHAVHDVVPAVLRPLGLLVAEAGVEEGRALDDRGEHGALGGVELGDVLVEVRLRGRLDAVGAAAVVDGVEVVLEDLVLGLLLGDLDRDQDLLGLAAQRLVAGQEVVLDVLLGDGRAALRLATAQGHPRAARDSGRGDAGVLVEVAVLGGEVRLLHRLGHLREGHRLAVDLADPVDLGLAVREVDDRRLGVGDIVGLGDVGRRVGDEEADDAEQGSPEGGQAEALAPEPGVEPVLLLLAACLGLSALRLGTRLGT